MDNMESRLNKLVIYILGMCMLLVVVAGGIYLYHFYFERGKELLDEVDRLNTFIEAGVPVYADGVPVKKVTEEVIASAKNLELEGDGYGIKSLLEEGYVMLVNGKIELSKDTALDTVLEYYCPYEVDVAEKIIVLKEKQGK